MNSGVLVSINTSDGGVPKRPIQEGRVRPTRSRTGKTVTASAERYAFISAITRLSSAFMAAAEDAR
jgi:hypothetical protein